VDPEGDKMVKFTPDFNSIGSSFLTLPSPVLRAAGLPKSKFRCFRGSEYPEVYLSSAVRYISTSPMNPANWLSRWLLDLVILRLDFLLSHCICQIIPCNLNVMELVGWSDSWVFPFRGFRFVVAVSHSSFHSWMIPFVSRTFARGGTWIRDTCLFNHWEFRSDRNGSQNRFMEEWDIRSEW